MVKATIDRSKCISCGACAASCPKLFHMAEDGKSTMKGSKRIGEKDVLELDKKDVPCAKNAEEVCPVKCISVK
jgi:ferredoxin